MENLGRINMGEPRYLGERKGLLGPVALGGVTVLGWEAVPYEFRPEDLRRMRDSACWKSAWPGREQAAPPPLPPRGRGHAMVFRGTLPLEAPLPGGTFVDLRGWRKGAVWINGFNLGRHWSDRGPQQRLYVPGPLLRRGENELLVLELHGPYKPDEPVYARTVSFHAEPGLDSVPETAGKKKTLGKKKTKTLTRDDVE